MMRLASALLVAVLLTTCAISGTFAKYTTSVTSQDAARVAYWGFQPVAMDITDLFDKAYDTTVNATVDVIAPGTTSSDTFAFAYNEANGTAPEVAYTFEITVDAVCDDLIKNNKNIQWKLDSGAWGTFEELVNAIKALAGEADGSADYEPNQLPAAFTAADDVHTISWQWLFTGAETYDHDSDPLTPDLTQDQYDTLMANAAVLDDVSIQITITATQID